jgi:ribonucleoside-diphosphate reductase alpha chain
MNAPVLLSSTKKNQDRCGIPITRSFSDPFVHPYDQLEWRHDRSAKIKDADGVTVIFEQTGIEAPASWSDVCVNVVADKYFRGPRDTPEREFSVKQIIDRVVTTITRWGIEGRYFDNEKSAAAFEADLTWLLVNQRLAFNSPVWFNVGRSKHPQCSACFINEVDDTMDSILELTTIEGKIFKYGSGAGVNLSRIRSSREGLSTGGTASGPLSFLKGWDAFAGAIKSGGATRRAAKMISLDVDHPDIIEFIRSKAHEEKKAQALIAAGYSGGLNGEAYGSVDYQNANHSVRVTDAFMRAVEKGKMWALIGRKDGRVIEERPAREIWEEICQAAWDVGCPGIQFHDTINAWNTCRNSGEIVASNPCSEYKFLNNTSCNLASINVLRYRNPALPSGFDIEAFKSTVRLLILAMEILVDNASYPTEKITFESRKYRTLGIGVANLGAYLMCEGLPYDSDEGRALAAGMISLMTAEAYATSSEMALSHGPFEGYAANREPMLDVIKRHGDANHAAIQDCERCPKACEILLAAEGSWRAAFVQGESWGYRNAQASVSAPTGTIAFLMDCDTTGIEPDVALVKYKTLAGKGEGILKLVNQSVPAALRTLGYDDRQREIILDWLNSEDTIEGAPFLKEEHLPVFDCAFKPDKGKRFISPMGHVRMLAAIQPFLSGASSKTLNLPATCTPQDVSEIYKACWELGVKATTIYRDGCKKIQPLKTSLTKANTDVSVVAAPPVRRELPDEVDTKRYGINVGGHTGFLHVGTYENGEPGEIFITMSKEGSTVSGFIHSFGKLASLALQYGVPLRAIVKQMIHTRFEPRGFTGNKDVPVATSILDYIGKVLDLKYLKGPRQATVVENAPVPEEAQPKSGPSYRTGPPCTNCGELTVPRGSCHTCEVCGTQTGCG